VAALELILPEGDAHVRAVRVIRGQIDEERIVVARQDGRHQAASGQGEGYEKRG
jgi:hypothetical protein